VRIKLKRLVPAMLAVVGTATVTIVGALVVTTPAAATSGAVAPVVLVTSPTPVWQYEATYASSIGCHAAGAIGLSKKWWKRFQCRNVVDLYISYT
jgi:hypothetical protein